MAEVRLVGIQANMPDISVQPVTGQGTITSVGQLNQQQPISQPPVASSSSSGVDKQALNLTHAIALTESNANYNAVGDNGMSVGAYQWYGKNGGMAHFQSDAKAANLDPNDFSPENQDKVAYNKIKAWKDQGYDPGQIASMWNSGNANNWQNHSGVNIINGKAIQYNTPAYVQKVYQHFKQLETQTPQYNPAPYSVGGEFNNMNSAPAPQEKQDKGFIGNAIDQLNNRAAGITKSIQDASQGKINWGSAALQSVGGLAGALGDVVGDLPVIKQVGDLVGMGAGKLAETPAGQSVIKSIQQFQQEHPELSGDIGATFNIATAIPILKGLSALKGIAADATSSALKNVAEKSVANDLTEVASRTIGGRDVLKNVPDAVKTIVDHNAIPELVSEGGVTRYSTANAQKVIGNAIHSIDQNELQPVLEQISSKQNFGQSLDSLKKLAIDAAENDPTLKEAGMVPQALNQIEKRFDGWKYSYGNNVDLATENRLKIGSGKFTEWGTPEGSADKSIYHALQHNIEDVAKNNGYEDVVKLTNQKMQHLINAQDVFQYIEGKTLKNSGLLHYGIKGASTAAGAGVGGLFGNPIVGGIAGYTASNYLEKQAAGFLPKALKYKSLGKFMGDVTRKQLLEQSIKNSTGKVGGLIGASIANRIANSNGQ